VQPHNPAKLEPTRIVVRSCPQLGDQTKPAQGHKLERDWLTTGEQTSTLH